MAQDRSIEVRRAILAALEDDAAVTAIVPAERIYAVEPPADPEWPFIRYGLAEVRPFRASGLDGSRLTVTLNGFARGPQEDGAATLGAAIATALDGLTLAIEPDVLAYATWAGSRLARDGDEAGAYRVIVGIDVTIAG